MKPELEKMLIQKRDAILDSPELAAIAKLESEVGFGFLEYCRKNGFVQIDVPHLTLATGACENFDTIFRTHVRDGPDVYLSQTGQLYLEAFLHQYPKTCCVGPSFRKEPRVDPRHAIEFALLEIEAVDCTLPRLREHAQGIIAQMIGNIESRCEKELDLLGIDPKWLETFKTPYNAITYEQAIKTLGLPWGSDLSHEQEQELVRQNGFKPLFVTHYPQEIKFFNMRENRENPKVVNSMDLLMPYAGESLGAAEREEDYTRLKRRLENSDMLKKMTKAIAEEPGMQDKSHEELKQEGMRRFDWYMEIVRKYPFVHGGFGMGKNRIFQSFLAAKDIRVAGSYVVNKDNLL
jgi:asparaginyl-tRNA synthetase